MPKLPEGQNPKKKTSISLDEKLLAAAKARFQRLRYRSFSEYLEVLIERDLREKGAHTRIREEEASSPSPLPTSRSSTKLPTRPTSLTPLAPLAIDTPGLP